MLDDHRVEPRNAESQVGTELVIGLPVIFHDLNPAAGTEPVPSVRGADDLVIALLSEELVGPFAHYSLEKPPGLHFRPTTLPILFDGVIVLPDLTDLIRMEPNGIPAGAVGYPRIVETAAVRIP